MAETIQTLSTKHLLGIKDLTLRDIELIFETADTFKDVLNRPIKKVPSLRDITIANIFFENSTRTRLSFELAQKRLSADVVNFTASSSSVSKGETLIDTVNNILSMKVDMVVMRHPYAGAGIFLSKHVNAQRQENSNNWGCTSFEGCFIKYAMSAEIRCRSNGLWPEHINPKVH